MIHSFLRYLETFVNYLIVNISSDLLKPKFFFFFFNYPATPEIYPFPLPPALPIPGRGLLEADGRGDVARVDLLLLLAVVRVHHQDAAGALGATGGCVQDAAARLELARVDAEVGEDRKSTRLNSSHSQISYAVFCLK